MILFNYSRVTIKKYKHILLMVAVIALISACNNSTTNDYSPQFSDSKTNLATVYIFGIHPLHNPQRLHEMFEPIMEYLSQNIENAEFKLEASRNYAAYDTKLAHKEFDFALPNPYQTIKAIDVGYIVFGKMGDDYNFRGVILVRKDSGISQPKDLIGKSISYPAPTALAATMMPQYFLQSKGVDVMNDLDNRYVGSQESSIMNVYHGNTEAGSTWPPPWIAFSKERPELAKELTVIWETEPLPNNSLIALPSVPTVILKQVESLLFDLHNNENGRKLLEPLILSKFVRADYDTYLPVRKFVKDFSQTIRPLN